MSSLSLSLLNPNIPESLQTNGLASGLGVFIPKFTLAGFDENSITLRHWWGGDSVLLDWLFLVSQRRLNCCCRGVYIGIYIS